MPINVPHGVLAEQGQTLAPRYALLYHGAMSPVSLRVRELRAARGMSQQKLADLAGLSRGTIADLERGESRGVDFSTLEKLATALGVDAALLIAHDRSMRKRRG